MTVNDLHTIRLERLIGAAIEVVFDAWLDPKSIAQWMCPGDGVHVPQPRLDAKVGGRFDFTMDVGGELLPHVGEYTVIQRPRLLGFTWISPGTHSLVTRVTLELSVVKADQTQIRLTHELLPDATAAQMHDAGWSRILDCLGRELTP